MSHSLLHYLRKRVYDLPERGFRCMKIEVSSQHDILELVSISEASYLLQQDVIHFFFVFASQIHRT